MHRTLRHLVVCMLLAGPAAAQTAAPPGWADEVAHAAQRNFPEYLTFLAIDNIPDKPEDIERNARFVEEAFGKRGFATERLDNPAHRPAVLARYRDEVPGAKTVLGSPGTELEFAL